MKIVLFSTSNVTSGRSADLERMLASVVQAEQSLEVDSVSLQLLFQGAASGYGAGHGKLPDCVRAMDVDGVVPLSAARNIMLSRAISEGLIAGEDVIAFPDDDCWYPDGVLDHIIGRFAADPELGFWFCRYGSEPEDIKALHPETRPSIGAVVRNASSNTIVVRGHVARAIGTFDETLGVGTPNFGGEDLDFALHAFRLAGRSLFADTPLIGHRDKNPQLRAKYYRGSLIVLARHARRARGAWYEYARKLVVGAYLGGRGELDPLVYARAVGASFSEAVRSTGS